MRCVRCLRDGLRDRTTKMSREGHQNPERQSLTGPARVQGRVGRGETHGRAHVPREMPTRSSQPPCCPLMSFGMVVAANLPKMACQLSCGFVCVSFSGANGSFHQLLQVPLEAGCPGQELGPVR